MTGKNADAYARYHSKFFTDLGKLKRQPAGDLICKDLISGLDPDLRYQIMLKAPFSAEWDTQIWTDPVALSSECETVWNALVLNGFGKEHTGTESPDKGSKKAAKKEHDVPKGQHRFGVSKKDIDKRVRTNYKRKTDPKHGQAGGYSNKDDGEKKLEVRNTVQPTKDCKGKELTPDRIAQLKKAHQCMFCLRPNHGWTKCRTYASKCSPAQLCALATNTADANSSPSSCRGTGEDCQLTKLPEPFPDYRTSVTDVLDFSDELAMYQNVAKYGIPNEVELPVPNLDLEGTANADLWNLTLDMDMYDYLCKKAALLPTLDACLNPTRALLQDAHCSEDSPFYQRDLSDQCVFLAPPMHSGTITKYLDHYLAEKAKNPALSALILLPKSYGSSWSQLASEKFQVLTEFPSKAKIWA